MVVRIIVFCSWLHLYCSSLRLSSTVSLNSFVSACVINTVHCNQVEGRITSYNVCYTKLLRHLGDLIVQPGGHVRFSGLDAAMQYAEIEADILVAAIGRARFITAEMA